MIKITKDRKTYGIILFILLLAAIIIFIVIKYNAKTPEEELYSLSKTITESELEQKGYIDISGALPVAHKSIDAFLSSTKGNQKTTLKTFQKQGNELYVKIFCMEPEWNEISLWTYVPWQGYALAPDKRFSTDYEVTEKDDIATVTLINVKNKSWPTDDQTLEDEVLCSYYTK